jgi:glucose/arabinose dehydrogenase
LSRRATAASRLRLPSLIGSAALAVITAVAGCGDGASDGTTPTVTRPSTTRPAANAPPTGDGAGGVRLVKLGDFDHPVYVTQPPGNARELYVVQQTGEVIVLRNGTALDTPFLDVSDDISFGGEEGLLSIAFAPDYDRSGFVYADYTNAAGDTRVVRFTRSQSDPLVVDSGSAREVLAIDQPYTNHNGGLVLFGPDGKLYVGLGDGGSEEDPDRVGQDRSTLLGKILRIDPRRSGEYVIPDSNPFIGDAGVRPEIYEYGLRNPWRFSFDPATGSLWIGDVGQYSFEEIDGLRADEAAGANLGWSAYEGRTRFNHDQTAPGHIPPVLVYSHDSGCSVTGGYVVRDRSLKSLYGRYLYGDYCSGELRSFSARAGRPARDDRALGLEVASLSSFGTDYAGHIYATSLDGPVYRLMAN